MIPGRQNLQLPLTANNSREREMDKDPVGVAIFHYRAFDSRLGEIIREIIFR